MVGREWVFEAIDAWRADVQAPRFLLIEGEPGIGKTAIARALVARGDLSAAHFCIARHADTIAPAAFARGLSRQLSALPAFRAALIDRTAFGVSGTAIAGRADGGYVTGVHIDHIGSLNVAAPSATDLFNEMVVYPLQRLHADGSRRPSIILVDALDEAVQYPGDATIATLLAEAQGLPIGVHFIVTARPDSAALRRLHGLYAPLPLVAGSPENMGDMRRYVRGRVAGSDALGAALAARNIDQQSFTARVVAASQGNFLYADLFLRAVEEGNLAPETLRDLPVGLARLYRESLAGRRIGPGYEGWGARHRPVLAALTVAETPLTLDHVGAFAGLSSQDAHAALIDMQQFLDPTPFKDGRYALYHQSLVDFLGDRDRAIEYWVDCDEAHRRVVAYYRGASSRWADANWRRVDDYGLRYLAAHLYALRFRDGIRADLYGLICRPFMDRKRAHFGSHESFASDVALVIRAARGRPDGDVGELVRCCLIHATLRTRSALVPPALLGALVRTGQLERARSIASLSGHPGRRCRAYQAIAAALLAEGRDGEAGVDIRAAMDAFDSIDDDAWKEWALDDLPVQLGSIGAADTLHRLQSWAEGRRDDRVTGSALEKVARGLLALGDDRRALDAAVAIGDGTARQTMLYDAARHLGVKGAWAGALEAARAIELTPFGPPALAAVISAQIKAGEMTRAVEALQTIGDAGWRVRVCCSVALALHDDGIPGAAAMVARADGMVGDVQGAGAKSTALRDVARSFARLGDYDHAEATASAIPSTPVKACALAELGAILHDAGHGGRAPGLIERAPGLIERAARLIETMGEGGSDRDDALSALAGGMARVGDARAGVVAEAVAGDEARLGALATVAECLSRAGKVEEAGASAERIVGIIGSWDDRRAIAASTSLMRAIAVLARVGRSDRVLAMVRAGDGLLRMWLLRLGAAALVEAGAAEDALEAARAIGDDLHRSFAIRGIVDALCGAGMVDELVAIADTVRDDALDIDILSDIVACLCSHKRWEAAQIIADRAIAAAESDAPHGGRGYDDGMAGDALPWALRAIANGMGAAGRTDEAARVVDYLCDVARRERDAVVAARSFALATGQYADIGRPDWATIVAAEAVASAGRVGEDGRWPFEARQTAVELAGAGFTDEAMAVAATIGQGTARLAALGEVSIAAAAAGNRAQAMAAIAATRAAMGDADARAVAEACASVARALFALDWPITAMRALARARRMARQVEDEVTRENILFSVAGALARNGRLASAMRVISAMRDPGMRDIALSDAALTVAQSGDIYEALDVCEMIGDDYPRSLTLGGIAQTVAWDADRATDGGIDRLVAATDTVPPHTNRAWMLGLIVHILVRRGRVLRAVGVTRWLCAAVEAGGDEDNAVDRMAEAHALAATGETARAERIVHETVASVEEHAGEDISARTLHRMLRTLLDVKAYHLALPVWEAWMAGVARVGRRETLHALGEGAPIIAGIDASALLGRVYDAAIDVEERWSHTMRSGS